MKIFTCYHKQYPVCASDVLTPIHVGKTLSKTDLGFLCDNTGNNISEKNPYYCELTATYWIWKNVTEDIVGLCHYRRYFNFNNHHEKINKLDADFANFSGNKTSIIDPIFKEFDIILPYSKSVKKHPVSLYDFYAKEHVQSDMDVLLDIIKEKHPEQYKTAYHVLHTTTTGYYANMLIAKKDVFDAYAKWMFGILFAVEEKIHADVLLRDTYQQRVYGFLSERMMTIYMALHPELKVKEVPVLYIEENEKQWKRYKRRQLKHKILSYLRLRKLK